MRVMRLSQNFSTSIHILLIIHEETKKHKVTSDVIAKILGISSVSARSLLNTLKKAGFITIAPRKEKEGTQLAKPLNEITLHDIFEAVEADCKEKFIDLCTQRSNNTYTGVYINEIISGYVECTLDAVKEELRKVTLEDTLANLKTKEVEYQYDKPRFTFIKNG